MSDETKKEEPKAANTEGESELSNDQLKDASLIPIEEIQREARKD